MPDSSLFRPYRKFMLMCTGSKCAPESSEPLYQHLKVRLRELGLDKGEGRIQRSKTSCLGICAQGPLMVVEPDGIWYHSLDEAKLERIIQEHILQDQPVEEFILGKNVIV